MFETQLSSDNRHKNILISIIGIVCSLLALSILFIWIYVFSNPTDERFVPIAFNSAQWKDGALVNSKQAVRICMVDDLLGNYQLEGKSRAEIISLLGEPDDNPGLIEWDMVYCLGPERSRIQMDWEWLVLRLNEQGQVTEYQVITT